MNIESVLDLIKKEGWEVIKRPGHEPVVLIEGLELPVRHPAQIALRLYRDSVDSKRKFYWMKRVFEMLWPELIPSWNYWTERRFMTHCEHWSYIVYAGGANCAKSHDAALIVCIDWLSDPKRNAILVASTSLSSLDSRIWGYVKRFMFAARKRVPGLPVLYAKSKPPKITYDYKLEGRKEDDSIHGMFAIAAKQGDDETVISSWIGRHPDKKLILVLDEATDMPMALLNSFINLDKGDGRFKCLAIGNSNSVFDIHGVMATPREGWPSISPGPNDTTLSEVPVSWETVRRNGICLFFSCYESPAIHESDVLKKKILSHIFITEEQIAQKKREYGEGTEKFFRMVVGFWKLGGTDDNVMSAVFLTENKVGTGVEWSGQYPWKIVGGLDAAYSVGGDDCILRLAVLGQDVHGQVVLDYRGEELLFSIPISPSRIESVEVQIADYIIEKSKSLSFDIGDLAVDANGAGRGLADVIQLRAGSLRRPKKVFAMRVMGDSQKAFDLVIRSTYELWFEFRNFIPTGQIHGLDNKTLQELSSRLELKQKNGRTVLETKREYKLRMGAINPSLGTSPDRADAAALCLQSAIINYGFRPGLTWSTAPDFQTFESQKLRAWQAMNRVVAKEETQKVKRTVLKPSFPDISTLLAYKRFRS